MKKQSLVAFALAFSMLPALSEAQPFSVFGPRALGMGGASVAAVNDSTAVYWNPAALADYRKVDIRIPASAAIQDHIGLEDKWNRINDIYSQVQTGDTAAINEMISLLNDLNKPNTGTDVDVSASLLISIPFTKSAIAISALGLGYAGVFPQIDTGNLNPSPASPDFVGNNTSEVAGIGIAATEPAISFATSFNDKVFIGANAKIIYAETFATTQTLISNNFDDFLRDLRDSNTESKKTSFDAGVLIAPTESFRIGIVGRDLNSPSFPFLSGEIELEPQYRAGLAWKPFKTLTLAADYDLSKNKTFTLGYESQTAAVGLEKTFFSEYFNLRLGANRNLADTNAKTIYTAGLGLRLFALQFNVAGGYDFDERQGAVSADLALMF